MGFVSRFVSILVRNWLGNTGRSSASKHAARRPCRTCGRLTPFYSLHDGVCGICRNGDKRKDSRQRWENEEQVFGESHRDLKAAYRFLGVRESDSDAEIKKKFRELAKQCHPDQFQDLPDHKISEANGLFRDLREAYEMIMKSRGAS